MASAGEHDKNSPAKDAAAQKMAEARRQWQNAMKQVEQPGKTHRFVRYATAQLPFHAQYLDAGTLYTARLEQPLSFGSELLMPKAVASIGAPPPAGSLVHALLVTPINSATSPKGSEVEAILAQPLFDEQHRLILPQGTRLRGTVLRVRPARHFHRNGQQKAGAPGLDFETWARQSRHRNVGPENQSYVHPTYTLIVVNRACTSQ